MKRTILLIVALSISGCGAVKGAMSQTAGLILPNKSDKMLKSNVKETVEVTEPDMFGVNTVRNREVIHKEPLRKLVTGIYVKPGIAVLPEEGGGAAPAKQTPKYELSAEVNLARYTNADDIRKLFGKCVVKAAVQYDEKRRTIEFPGGEVAFGGVCEPLAEPYGDLRKFFERNKTFGYDIRYGFPTPYHLLRKKALPELVEFTFSDGKELRDNIVEFKKSWLELSKIFPKTRISEKDHPAVTPEALLERLKLESQQKEIATTGTVPDEAEVDRYTRGIVLEGDLFSQAEDPAQTEKRLNSYRDTYPRKNILLLAKHYLFVAGDQVTDAENIILDNGQSKVNDFFQGSTVEALFESAWPDYYRAALEKTKAWIAVNTRYDTAKLEKLFFAQVASDRALSKKKLLLDRPTFMKEHYPDVVIYLLANSLKQPENDVETRFVNTFNYYSSYDDFEKLHDFLLFNVR